MTRLLSHFAVFFAIFIASVGCSSGGDGIQISTSDSSGSLAIVKEGIATPIIIDKNDAEVISIVANAFAKDIQLITGVKPEISTTVKPSSNSIILIGTIGQNHLIDSLISAKKIDASRLVGKWETFQIAVIENPLPNVKTALVVVGSDRRGTAFGTFELSAMMGVSPWVWWADVLPAPRKELYASAGNVVEGPPSVKFRGIFLNDEDWGLQPWAASKLDTAVNDIGPNTYAHIFELMLRMKANFIWPAMHPCTKAFYYYPENPKMADKYGIIVGSSHCEPLLRNNVDEWNNNFVEEYGEKPKDWRYDKNKEQIYRYWEDRAKQSKDYESNFTIGMRGIHDSSIPGPKDKAGKIKLLEQVIRDQREIIANNIGDSTKVAQLFCPYKEVLELYQDGLKLPDDITIVWADDNHGYIRQLSTPDEQKRSGGSGFYYHLSYWGAPHDYLWLSSISPSLISYEFTKAHQFGADRLWVVNVGDIKPAELETQFAMEMAWDVNKWTPQTAHEYARDWAKRTFGEEFADDIAAIKSDYYRLSQNAKPEHLGMLKFSDKVADERLHDYAEIVAKSKDVFEAMPNRLKDAYFQLVHYPVMGADLMNQKVFYAQRSLELAKKGDAKALDYSTKALAAFEQIKSITNTYNKEIAGGKWDGIMSYNPRGLPVFNMPRYATAEDLQDPSKIVEIDYSKQKYLSNIPGISATKSSLKGDSIFVIQAAEFTYTQEFDGEVIEEMPGLGLGGRSISRYPFTGTSFTDANVTKAPFVEYGVELEAGRYLIKAMFLPTQRINSERSMKYAISIDDVTPKIVNVDPARSKRYWNNDVLRGYSVGETEFAIEQSLQTAIRIYIMDTGLALSRLEVVRLDD